MKTESSETRNTIPRRITRHGAQIEMLHSTRYSDDGAPGAECHTPFYHGARHGHRCCGRSLDLGRDDGEASLQADEEGDDDPGAKLPPRSGADALANVRQVGFSACACIHHTTFTTPAISNQQHSLNPVDN